MDNEMAKNRVDYPSQAATSGRDATQVGGNFTQTSSSNNRVIYSFVFILAFGGLALGIYISQNMKAGGPTHTEPKPVQVAP